MKLLSLEKRTASNVAGLPQIHQAVHASGLRITRGRRHILDRIELDISPGSVVGVLGPSGSGKTSLLRSVAGLQSGVTGTLEVFGVPASSRAARQLVGYVPQQASLYNDLSAWRNLAYFAALDSLPKRRVDEVLEATGLTEHATKLVRQLSGGQCGRLSIAVALLGNPRLLVLDEPTVGLDPMLRASVWRTLEQLRQGGTTILMSTHLMDDAERCEQIIILKDGMLISQTSPAELSFNTGEDDLKNAFITACEGVPAQRT